MGIEIPPPKGGPVVFPNPTDPRSPHVLEDDCLTPELGEASEHNGQVSLCLSDGGKDFHAADEWDHTVGFFICIVDVLVRAILMCSYCLILKMEPVIYI